MNLSRNATLAAAAAAALIAVAPAAASADAASPVAKAAGGDVPPIVPSLIQTRITRTENAIDRLTNYVDDNDTAGVTRTGKVIRRQLAAAWRGAVWYIKNPPPPVADDAQDADDGPLVADQFQASAAVFDTYHAVAATIAQLTDGARVPVLNDMSKTLFWTLDARDKAVAQVHTLDVPPVPTDPEEEPEEPEGEAGGFALTMPGVVLGLDDEEQQISGLKSDATDLRPGGTKILNQALAQTNLTETQINTFWPPATED